MNKNSLTQTIPNSNTQKNASAQNTQKKSNTQNTQTKLYGSICKLSTGHVIKDCYSAFKCRYCGGKHNSLLHKPNSNPNPHVENTQASTSQNAVQSFSTHTQSSKPIPIDDRTKLLGTAVLNVEVQGELFPARALIDPASDFSFITDKLRRKLKLPTTPIVAEISGLNEIVSARSNKLCQVLLRSNTQNDLKLNIQAIVVKTLTKNLPTQNLNPTLIQDLENIQLADQRFSSRPIDFIIGSDFYPQILKSGVRKDLLDTLIAQETEFGWILTGPVQNSQNTQPLVSYFSSVTLDKVLTKFWEIEDVPTQPKVSEESSLCEETFMTTTLRLPNGRYQVNLPFIYPPVELGNSRHVAMAQFLRNEKSLMKKPELKMEYDNVLQEYIDLGHMKPIKYNPNTPSNTHYYLPHHAVVKLDRVTTKISCI
ncbi:uncharacterized protein LOC119608858 [Lucilia sericata]|uniref:uncharacterized protein LOC119608858 n=1 Tax=Lucilia sericata TaxID=13632 RepID=UPI0018A8651F|nr:uncharacterized protein LOC119608858 [Lucilia sericata]